MTPDPPRDELIERVNQAIAIDGQLNHDENGKRLRKSLPFAIDLYELNAILERLRQAEDWLSQVSGPENDYIAVRREHWEKAQQAEARYVLLREALTRDGVDDQGNDAEKGPGGHTGARDGQVESPQP